MLSSHVVTLVGVGVMLGIGVCGATMSAHDRYQDQIDLALPSSLSTSAQAPTLQRLGTVDLGILAETTPVVWRGRMLLFECLQSTYYNNTSGKSHLRFVDVETGRRTTQFGEGHGLGNAVVVNNTMFVFATVAPSGLTGNNTLVSVFWSDDDTLSTWHTAVAFYAKAFNTSTIWNTSVQPGPIPSDLIPGAPYTLTPNSMSTTRTQPGFLLAFEFPQAVPKPVGGTWQTGFAASTDLKHWSHLRHAPAAGSMFANTSHANPTVRYVEPYWYVITTRCTPKTCATFVEEIFRSKDLATWEARPGWRQDDVMAQPLIAPSREDQVVPNKGGFNPDTKAEVEAHAAAVKNATNINVSDMDLNEFVDPKTGKVVTLVYWSWGDQGLGLTAMALAVGLVEAPISVWLPSLF
eukprot:m.104443 g.104443  ORF g.104443 m.104443 type:complete len:406 (-) comp27568_c0_seq1:53-1270(-)